MVTMLPGVFVEENQGLVLTAENVSTCIPAFIGYTEKADHAGTPLRNAPWRVDSMPDFERCFGGAPTALHVRFSFSEVPTAQTGALALVDRHYLVQQTHGIYLLHRAMQLYFLNGGGPCFVVSVGGYAGSTAPGVHISAAALGAGLQALQAEPVPAVVLIPEAVLLPKADCDTLQNQVLTHCGVTLQSRFAILDVREGYKARNAGPTDCVQDFRDAISASLQGRSLSFGAAYYPWLNTSIVPASNLGFNHLGPDSLPVLLAVMRRELMSLKLAPAKRTRLLADVERIATVSAGDAKARAALVSRWAATSPALNALLCEMARQLNLLPPSAAVAGVFVTTDTQRGVWKAPANVALKAVLSPCVSVTDADQDTLNVDVQHGKSVNAIRTFVGKGTLVWGGRTLDGNSADWRYISTRRFFVMVEQSAQRALAAFVFEPNNAGTWLRVQALLENYLTALWRQGALAGSKPEHAFAVRAGLGVTMTALDVADGLLIVEMMLAPSRPAEFIVIRLTQQVQAALA